MAVESLVEDIRRSIWHAFTALAKGEDGQVAKSSLKVLTNNIGQALGSDKAEELINNDDDSADCLSFYSYFSLIRSKVLLPEDSSESALLPTTCGKIDEICWMLCEAHYHKNSLLDQRATSLNGDDLFKLWKMFNFLAKVDLDSDKIVAMLPLRMDVEECQRLGSLIRQAVGYSAVEVETVDPTEENQGCDRFAVDFVHFVNTVCLLSNGLSSYVLSEGVNLVTQHILSDVMKKGFLEKFGNHVTTWKKRWFRLSGREMKYFTTDLEQELKGTIEIGKSVRLENLPQRTGHKQFRFKIHTSNKSFELAAPDLRSKNEWLVALQIVSDNVGQEGSIQRNELLERERARKQRRAKAQEVLIDKLMMREKLQSRDQELKHEMQERMKDKSLLEQRELELEAERLARLETEARLAKEEEALEVERERLRELEEIRAMLERLLEEERQAKRDEEIVRNLQSRILLEETEKREQLEKLQAEQERLLQQEREEKLSLQEAREKQEALLNAAQQQLNQLAQERLQAEQQFREAEEKIRTAEEERRKMEERLRLREMSTSVAMQRPRPLPNPDPFVTHRGQGAFVEADFCKKIPEGIDRKRSTEGEDLS